MAHHQPPGAAPGGAHGVARRHIQAPRCSRRRCAAWDLVEFHWLAVHLLPPYDTTLPKTYAWFDTEAAAEQPPS